VAANKEHATLSASESERWMVCPGSIALIAKVGKVPSSAAAEEGTAAHEVAALCLTEGLSPVDLIGRMFNDFEVDIDMAEHLDTYIEYIAKLISARPDATLYVEHLFDLSWLRPEMWGTNDVCISEYLGELIVIDLKFGRGVIVDPKENSQLLYYALGALQSFDDETETVRLVIVQPRGRHSAGPIREWSTTAQYVRDWGIQLGLAADKTREPNAALQAGEHCRFCNAAGICPQLKQLVQTEANIDFAIEPSTLVDPLPVPTNIQELTRALDFVPVIDIWCKGVEAMGLQLLNNQQKLPGYKLVQGRANRKWTDEDAVIKLMKKLKVERSKYCSEKLKSPAQLEKLSAVGKDTVKELCYKPEGKITIAPEDDARPAIAPQAAVDFLEGASADPAA